MNWEAWLRASAEPSSNAEEERRDRTYEQIRAALSDYDDLRGRPYRVYVKGSYANNTNVRLNYDVDVAVEYEGYFYYDLCFDLKGAGKEKIGVHDSTDPYTRSEFVDDIRGALETAFGASAVEQGEIAFRVRERKTTLPADVVPCWQYRRYDRISASGLPVFQEGSRVFPRTGGHADNFPAQQKRNGADKNVRTGHRYKRMVRALKRLQALMVVEGDLSRELPSYLIECLVYNVPDESFGQSTYVGDMRAVLATIFNATLKSGNSGDWEEVNGLKYLFHDEQVWTVDQVHDLSEAAWIKLGFD